MEFCSNLPINEQQVDEYVEQTIQEVQELEEQNEDINEAIAGGN